MTSKVKSTIGPDNPAIPDGISLIKAGTAADTGVTFYEYNVWNGLVETIEGDKTITCKYNGEGLRVEKAVNGQVTRYLYEYDKVVLEVDEAGSQTARNIQGLNILARVVDSETSYYMYNGHGDVTALIGTSGEVIASYYYDAFGNIVEKNENVGITNPFRYAGYRYDDETNLYYLNARYYDSKIARFLTEDTYRGSAADPLSLNLYTYCHNEPIMYWDPSGHWEVGDEKLNVEAQAKIIALTNAYWEATTKAERDVIHKQANKIREDKASYKDIVSPLKIEAGVKITTAVKKGVSTRGNMTKDEWVRTINNVDMKYFTDTGYHASNTGYIKDTNTVTLIGRTDLGVSTSTNLSKSKATASVSTTYNLSYNETKFVSQVASNSDYSLEEIICLFDILEINNGKIKDSDLQSIVGDNYYSPKKWYKKLIDPSTADVLELAYKTSSIGRTIAEIDYMMTKQRLDQVYNLMYLQALCSASNANLNIGPRDPYFINVNGKDVAYTEPKGYIFGPNQRYGAPGSYININANGYSVVTQGAAKTIKVGDLDSLPQNAKNMYNKYDSSGWKGSVPGQTPGTAAGSKYLNRDAKLPTTDSAGNSITYKEFDVNNKLPDAGRDAQRFVRGSDGSVYYTNDHYGTFTQIK